MVVKWAFWSVVVLLSVVECKRTVCVKKQFTVERVGFYQRIESSGPIDCVERCLDSPDACKLVVFIEPNKVRRLSADGIAFQHQKALCQLYNVNTGSDPILLRKLSRHEPPSTVYEVLDVCPANVVDESSQFIGRLSSGAKRVLNGLKTGRRGLELLSERDDASINRETYLTMEKPTYPFNGQTKIKSKSSVEKENYESDLRANGGDAGAPVPVRQDTQNRASLQPIQPIVGHNTNPSIPGFGAALGAVGPVLGSTGGARGGYVTAPGQGQTLGVYQPVAIGQPSILCPTGPCSPAYPALVNSYPCQPLHGPYDPCHNRPNPSMSVDTPAQNAKPYWSEWLPVGTCSVTCGAGVRMRKRTCSNGAEEDCGGDSTKEEPCIQPECNVWSEWTSWGKCTSSCGGGTKSRTRVCRNGNECSGPTEDIRECAEEACPQWTHWTSWGECSATCGQGVQRRIRECIPPGSGACQGPASDHQPCEQKPCPTWGQWERWSDCSKSCGMGERIRRRECVNGLGDDCFGPHEEHLLCNPQGCPEWTQWTVWGQCSKSCGDEGTRECHYEGLPSTLCPGTAQDQSACQMDPCPHWGDWSSWSPCSATCGHGQQVRNRECEPKGFGCTGGDREIRFCQQAVCPYWDQWTEWAQCSVSCGRGTTLRRRKCVKDDQLPGAVLPSEEELNAGGVTESERPEPAPIEQEDDNDGPEVEAVDSTEASNEEKPGASGGRRSLEDRARLLERAQQLRNSTTAKNSRATLISPIVGRQRPQLREQTLEVTQSAAAERRRAPIKATILELRDAPEGCPGPDTEQTECDAGPCCEWSSWSAWTDCNNPCSSGNKLRSRSCQVQIPYSPNAAPLSGALPFGSGAALPTIGHQDNYINIYARPKHDHVRRYSEDLHRRRRRQAGSYGFQPYVQQVIGTPQAGPITPQLGQPIGGQLLGQPFGLGTSYARGCECPGKSVETDQCDASEIKDACGNGGGVGRGLGTGYNNGRGFQPGGGQPFGTAASHQIQVQPSAVSGHAKSGIGNAKGVGSSVEITNQAREMDVHGGSSIISAVTEMMHTNGQCEWGSWGSWNTCRGQCKKGHRARTRACRRGGGEQTYERVARDEGECQCDGDEVDTEDCVPSGCEASERDAPPPSSLESFVREEEDPVLSCYWSDWTEWGPCGQNLLKKRTRLCVGLRALLTNCECMGSAVQQTSCSPEDEPKFEKKPSPAVLSVSRDILQHRLEDLEAPKGKGKGRGKLDSRSISSDSDEVLDALDSCDWLSWTEWSQCGAPCDGDGERKRTRTCPCRSCVSGVSEQSEKCKGDPCVSTKNHKKYPFD